MSKRKSFWGGVVTGALAVLLIAGGVYLGSSAWKLYSIANTEKDAVKQKTETEQGKETEQEAAGIIGDSVANKRTLQKLEVLENAIDQFYLESADSETLESGVYKGLIQSLGDPYSTYYTAEELADLEEKSSGVYYGIGAYVGIDTATALPILTSIIEGTPAEESGLRAGDLVYKVDGQEIQGMELNQAVSLIKGAEGTVVHLTIIREGEMDYLEMDVTRRKVESPTVEYEMLDDRIGYIGIVEFDDITVDQFAEGLAVLRGKGMEGLILDLRGNPGGNLSAVCEIARQMLPEGLIVYTEDKYGERDEYTCDGTRQMTEKLVVLINEGSASASEILAGAVKDYQMGTLMGMTTFGKGIVQRVLTLTDGSAVKLTVSKYFTPNGNDIHKLGVAPDIEVPFDADAFYDEGIDNQLEEAIRVMDGLLDG